MIQFSQILYYLKKQQTPLLIFSFASFTYPISKILYTKVHHYLFPPEKLKTEIELYAEKHVTRFSTFSEKYNEKERNQNIAVDFYNKKILIDNLRDANNATESTWKTRLLFENTPRGNIVMYYDPYKFGFAYYSDNSSIPYPVLNAVAMKYVITFRCYDFFFDNQDIKQTSPLIKIHSEQDKKELSKEKKQESDDFKAKIKDAPFLKRKKKEEEKKEEEKKEEEKKEEEKKEKKEEIPKYRNCFVHMGKMCNMSFLKVPPQIKQNRISFTSGLLDALDQETTLQKQVMNYKDYKNNIVVSV
uniref:Uncharacterized protein n=1 Tax=viral metagenome TaxID=1070528 RepID=A0A6C0IKX1_9ZZZZ